LIQDETINISQIIEALPSQVYLRRGVLVVHFSDPADLIGRDQEIAAALGELSPTDSARDVDRPSRARRVRAGVNGDPPPHELARTGNRQFDEADTADTPRAI
jgi:hypothetical protein